MSPQKSVAFQLKAHYFPITVIKFISSNPSIVLEQLKQVQELVPNYFQRSPVVLDVTAILRSEENFDLSLLCSLLRDHQLIPVGVQGLLETEKKFAEQMGLAIWQHSAPEKKSALDQEACDILSRSKYDNYIVTKPVRSGTHIYAQDSHLILLAPVSSGAECIADGDIHCYAPVRGRLLAGAKDNQDAQIFCTALEAELVAVAGYYCLYDEYPKERAGYLQISLNQRHHIEITNFAAERSKLCQE